MFDIFKIIFKSKEKESPDTLGLFPERVHIEAMPERRYLWTSRVLVIIACFSICFNMMLASSLYVMLPQRGSVPRLFYVDRYFNQMEIMQPFEINYPVANLITEEHITNYIMLRYMITNDYDEMKRRWRPGSFLYWMSSQSVFSDFNESDMKYNMEQFRKNIIRDVEIEWIRGLSRGLWQVQFRTLDYLPGRKDPVANVWRAALRVVYVKMDKIRHNEKLKNPFGFMIDSYSVSYLGQDKESEHYLSESKKITRELFFK